jgi:hypothetical protein
VAYQRVVVKERSGGHSVYEFDVEGMLTPNEWAPSKVSVARPSTGTSTCFELANIRQGAGKFPFPPDPDFDFAKAHLKKVTNFRDDGVKEREVEYTYQRVYRNGSSIRKIYGLTLEELPTYYFNGTSYQGAKMFLYSKYEVFSEVKTELASQKETIYNSSDLLKETATTTNYFFTSPNHGEVTRIETINSDGSISRNKITYSKDYAITSGNGTAAVAIAGLNTANRILPIEKISSIVAGGVESVVGAQMSTYQTIDGKVHPHQQYSFTSADGITTFEPSASVGGSTFQYDQSNYVLENTVLKVDSYGNVSASVGKDRVINSVGYGYGGTLPVLQVKNANVAEIGYTDFETSLSTNYWQMSWSNPQYVTGRNNSKGLVMLGSLVYSLRHNHLQPRDYLVSLWLKSQSSGIFVIQVSGPGMETRSFGTPFSASPEYTYHQFRIPVASLGSTDPMLFISLSSSTTFNIDDIAIYPDQSQFVANAYLLPNGKSSETDSRGVSTYFEYDLWGRLKIIYDQNKNLLKKFDFGVKP